VIFGMKINHLATLLTGFVEQMIWPNEASVQM
jgi:hypothetical protein